MPGTWPSRIRPRRTLRTQLALVYATLFGGTAIVLLSIPFLGYRSTVRAEPPGSGSAAAQQGADVHHQVTGSVLALAVAVLLSLALGWLMAGRLLRPVRAITAAAREISASNLHRRLRPGRRGDEFTELAGTLNDLFGRLEASFASQRQFVASASHELRTPLTAERALLQVTMADPAATAQTLRAACEEALALGEQQERLIGALLTLASSERGIEQPEPADLAAVARDVAAARDQEASQRGISVETTLRAAPVLGDPSLIESLIANLADNALRHNVPGGRVEISTGTAAGQAVLSVRNTGQVIPAGEVGRLLEPFQQLGRQRVSQAGGHGLGLAIVQSITRAHGARLTAAARPAGGLDIEIIFPEPAPPAAGRPGPAGRAAGGDRRTATRS
jgi:signal transduction histidine kinase